MDSRENDEFLYFNNRTNSFNVNATDIYGLYGEIDDLHTKKIYLTQEAYINNKNIQNYIKDWIAYDTKQKKTILFFELIENVHYTKTISPNNKKIFITLLAQEKNKYHVRQPSESFVNTTQQDIINNLVINGNLDFNNLDFYNPDENITDLQQVPNDYYTNLNTEDTITENYFFIPKSVQITHRNDIRSMYKLQISDNSGNLIDEVQYSRKKINNIDFDNRIERENITLSFISEKDFVFTKLYGEIDLGLVAKGKLELVLNDLFNIQADYTTHINTLYEISKGWGLWVQLLAQNLKKINTIEQIDPKIYNYDIKNAQLEDNQTRTERIINTRSENILRDYERENNITDNNFENRDTEIKIIEDVKKINDTLNINFENNQNISSNSLSLPEIPSILEKLKILNESLKALDKITELSQKIDQLINNEENNINEIDRRLTALENASNINKIINDKYDFELNNNLTKLENEDIKLEKFNNIIYNKDLNLEIEKKYEFEINNKKSVANIKEVRSDEIFIYDTDNSIYSSNSSYEEKSLVEYDKPDIQKKSLTKYNKPDKQIKSLTKYNKSDKESRSLTKYNKPSGELKYLRQIITLPSVGNSYTLPFQIENIKYRVICGQAFITKNNGLGGGAGNIYVWADDNDNGNNISLLFSNLNDDIYVRYENSFRGLQVQVGIIYI